MLAHGHRRSDVRHRHLHEVAFEKLRREPGMRQQCLALVERWLRDPATAPSRRWLEQWRDMLLSWPLARIADVVLDDDAGQILRRCSPLGPVLTPRERWAALADVDQSVATDIDTTTR